MQLRQLEAFVAVAEERSFTRAAARLYVAQSGLSATVRSLERELRASLFVRTTRRVELTEAGRALLLEARRALLAARAGEEAVAAVEGLERGTLAIGVMQAGWLFDLPASLARYRAAHPAIQIRLRQASSEELATLLDDGTLELFTTASETTPSRIRSLPLVESPLAVVCARGDVLADRQSVNLRAVAGRNQVGFPRGWGVRTVADRAMHAVGLETGVDLEVNDTTTLLDLVEAGLGVAILPEALARNRPSLFCVRLRGRNWTWTIAAQSIAPEPINPAAKAFWRMLWEGRTC